MDKQASQKYLIQQVMSASPARLIAMLLDRAVGLLNEAVEAIEAGDVERRYHATFKAYPFMLKRLTAVDVENDAQAAREVIQLLEPLRRTWHELAAPKAAEAETQENRSGQGPTSQVTFSA
jgi:flagellar protein FliS